MAESILVLNVGSSTLKFGIFRVEDDDTVIQGVVDRGGPNAGELRTIDSSGRSESSRFPLGSGSLAEELLRFLDRQGMLTPIQAVGHRLVHGGDSMREPVRVDASVRALLNQLVPLAPKHLPAELSAIDAVSRLRPSIEQIACFDTAFHSSLPRVARLFAIPRELSEAGIRRFGFHGLSYEYVTTTLRERGELPSRTIVAHLGNGASICAVLEGASIDTSMGMTPSGGLVMSTRSGDLDPGLLLYLMRERGYTGEQLEEVTDGRGGLLGISGLSGDVRELLFASATNDGARAAIDAFCYQIRKFVGAYAVVLGGLDALIFTGGIGEHSSLVRASICGGLHSLGLTLDPELNTENAPLVSNASSRILVRTIHTREDVMIARHVRAVLAGRGAL